MAKKFSLKKANMGDTIMGAAVGVGAGIAAKFIDTKLLSTQSNLMQGVIMGVAGAALPMFVPGKITSSAGAALVGVAGYKLSTEVGIAGIGVPGLQNSTIGAADSWIAQRAYPVATEKATNANNQTAVTMD